MQNMKHIIYVFQMMMIYCVPEYDRTCTQTHNLCIPEYDRTWTSNLCVLEYDRTRTRKSYIPYSAQPASSNLDNLRDVLVRQNSYEMYSFFIWMVFDWLLTTKGRPDNKIYCFSFFCVLRRSVCITVRRTRMYMKMQSAK